MKVILLPSIILMNYFIFLKIYVENIIKLFLRRVISVDADLKTLGQTLIIPPRRPRGSVRVQE